MGDKVANKLHLCYFIRYFLSHVLKHNDSTYLYFHLFAYVLNKYILGTN